MHIVMCSQSKFACFYLVDWLRICICVLLLVAHPVAAQGNGAANQSAAGSIHDSIYLEISNATLDQALDAISDKTGVKIVWRGAIPPKTVDYSLGANSVLGLLEKTMLLFDVSSFVTTRHEVSGELVAIEVIGFEGNANSPFGRKVVPASRSDYEGEDGLLSDKQRQALLDRSDELDESSFGAGAGPLTDSEKEAIKRLDDARSESEVVGRGSLNEEQLELLKEQSYWIEIEEQEDVELTATQLRLLKINSRKIERELEESSKPLSEEQVRELRGKEQ